MPDFIPQLRRHLLELGCPATPLARLVREVAEHREDLVQAALDEGLSATEAEARADERLGNPQALAADLMVTQRQASWCGRHRLLAFGLLPLLTFPVLWALVLSLSLALGYAVGFMWSHDQLRRAADNPAIFPYLVLAFTLANYVAIAVAAHGFYRLAGRTAAGWIALGLAGLICTLHSLFFHTTLSPHSISLNLMISSHPQWPWQQAAIPGIVLGLAYLKRQRRMRRELNVIPT